MGLLSGHAPDDLGLDQHGKLRPCPPTPNAVNSEDPDPSRRVDPLPYPEGDPAAARSRLRKLLEQRPRTEICRFEGDYVHAEASTKWLGFVDDVEFRFDDAAKVVQHRSASRLGKGDFGVNRKRAASLLAEWESAPK